MEFEARHIRNQAPTREELAGIASRLPGGADELLSRRSVRFRELDLAGKTLTEDQLLDLLAAEPKLLRRPIILDGERVVVGATKPALATLLDGGSGTGEASSPRSSGAASKGRSGAGASADKAKSPTTVAEGTTRMKTSGGKGKGNEGS